LTAQPNDNSALGVLAEGFTLGNSQLAVIE